MNSLQLEQVLDGIAIVIARKACKFWPRWVVYLVEKITDEQQFILHKTKYGWIREIIESLEDLLSELERAAQ